MAGYHKRPKNRQSSGKTNKMDIILLVVGTVLLAFTVVMIIIYVNIGSVPDTLITCVFAALGGECGAMAWIKTTKERRQEREWELEDEERKKDCGND